MLFSGSDQGVSNDNIPTNTPFSSCNLGASLIAKGYSFAGYSEDIPSVGSLISASGAYTRKHCPWTNWQGLSLPASVGQNFANFATNLQSNNLPTVSFAIPNLNDGMGLPTNDSITAIHNGDNWVQNNFAGYISWAKTNNSLLILTFDRNVNPFSSNQITTIFLGPMVKGGTYSNIINHYSILRILEEMYGCLLCGESANVNLIDYIWKTTCDNKNKPLVDLGSDTTFCVNDTIILNATNSNATYLWQDSSTNATLSISKQGTYWVKVTAKGCVSGDTINIKENNNKPLINLGSDTTICLNDTIILNATNSNSSYLWQDSSTNATFSVSKPGTYLVKVTAKGCVSKDTINIKTESCKTLKAKQPLSCSSIYPNPFKRETTIESDKKFIDASITIYDIFGQKLKIIQNITQETFTLELADFQGGVYILYLQQENTKLTCKIIIID
jgi:hypothetical protein